MNPKDIAARRRAPLHLFPSAGLVLGSLAMRDGAQKYGIRNWREKPVSLTAYLGAMRRHILAVLEGEDDAQDSGLPHLAHVIATASILLDAEEAGTLIDDRVHCGAAPTKLLDTANMALKANLPLNVVRALHSQDVSIEDDCMVWQGSTNAHGYGIIWRNSKCYQAHRVCYATHNGPIPHGHLVRHTCENPPCINPLHLLSGTHAENSQDMVDRGRSTSGERNPNSKLTDAEREEIGMLLRDGRFKNTEIAEQYGISKQRVQDFKRKLTSERRSGYQCYQDFMDKAGRDLNTHRRER